MTYPEYEDLCQQRQAGDITDVEFVRGISEDVTDEYEAYCAAEGINPADDDSAAAFLDYREQLFEESMEY